jgi:hypothetical protein
MRPRRSSLAVLALAFALFASPLSAAYLIYLKDGSSVTARDKYTVKDGRAIIVLLNGTQSFVKASEIDVPRTEKANQGNIGNAVVIPGDPRPIGPQIDPRKKDKTLKDLIANRETAPRDLPTSRRNKEEVVPGRIGKTKAGFTDLSTLTRNPYPQLEVVSDLQQFFQGQGVDAVELYEGTQGDRPLLELTTNSEASVFKALLAASNALIHIRGLHPQRVAAFEILMTTPARERAGQFVLTPQMAEDLIAKRVEVASFFLQNVQF